MNSIILELESQAINPNCDIVTLLRKAHVIASKLNLNEFDTWIMWELNGYTNYDDVPEYREIYGELEGWNPSLGWISVIPISEKAAVTQNKFCTQRLHQSISELIELYNNSKDNHFVISFTNASDYLSKCTNFSTKYRLRFSTHFLKSIVEKVRNCILEWALKLEKKGILGENMIFNDNEKENATAIPQTINNYYGSNIINGDISESELVNGNENNVTFNNTEIHDTIKEIKTAIESEQIDNQYKESALEILSDINSKIIKKSNPTVIESFFSTLKTLLTTASATNGTILLVQKAIGLLK